MYARALLRVGLLITALLTLAMVAAMLGACGGRSVTSSDAPQAAASLPVPLPTTVTMPALSPRVLATVAYTDPLRVTGHYPNRCKLRQVPGDGGPEALPDAWCTPGAVGDKVTQDVIGSTICRTGWTDTVRPPASVTEPVKTAAMLAYGIPLTRRGTVELDHLVPLSLGGADDVANLWPEPSDIPGAGFTNRKDQVERALLRAVCAHRVPLAAAQRAIAADWTTARKSTGA